MDVRIKNIVEANSWGAILLGYFIVFCGVFVYNHTTHAGLLAAFGDSWIYADMAKRLGILKSLKMDRVFDLVYPPLYAMLISPAYALFHDNTHIFSAIKTINMAVYALIFYPIFKLLKEYCRLPLTASFCGAILLSFSPCTIHYSKWFLSEPLYIPLVGLTFYCIFREKHFGSLWENIYFGLLLAALPLTKEIGNVVVMAFVLLAVGQTAGIVATEHVKSGKLKNLVATCAVLVCVLFIQRLWFKGALPMETGGYSINLSHSNLLIPGYWIDRIKNIAAYILISPQLIFGPFVLWLLLSKGKLLFTDRVLLMVVLCWIGHIVIIPLFTPADVLRVYHGRYLMPFAFVQTVIGVKYLNEFDKKSFLAISIMLILMFIAGWPADLRSFANAYMDGIFYSPDVLHLKATAINMSYLSVMLMTTYFLYRHKGAGLKTVVTMLLVMTFCGNCIQGKYNGGVAKFEGYDCGQLGTEITARLSAQPTLKLYVDDTWRDDKSWVIFARIMFTVPAVPRYISAMEAKGKKDALFLTSINSIDGVSLLAHGEGLSLFKTFD